jgi:hypothetical protein
METIRNSIEGESSERRGGQQDQTDKTPRRKGLTRADVLVWAQSMIKQQADLQSSTASSQPPKG